MPINKQFITKDLLKFQSQAQRKMIRKCDDCSVGLVVAYICPKHLKECEKDEI